LNTAIVEGGDKGEGEALEAAVEVAVVDGEEGRHESYPLESSAPITQPVMEIVEAGLQLPISSTTASATSSSSSSGLAQQQQQAQQQQHVNMTDRIATFYTVYTSREQEAIVSDYISKQMISNDKKSKFASNVWKGKSKNNTSVTMLRHSFSNQES